jgi:hypothetical protein
MKQELTVRLRTEIRRQLERGLCTLESLAIDSDLSVTTLKRFVDDGELSTSATMRVAHALGLVHRLRVSAAELNATAPDGAQDVTDNGHARRLSR